MGYYANENAESGKIKEYRNLAEFSGLSVEEIKMIDTTNHGEYLKIYARYKDWCLKTLNERCFKFNEEQKRKMQQQIYHNDDGITA